MIINNNTLNKTLQKPAKLIKKPENTDSSEPKDLISVGSDNSNIRDINRKASIEFYKPPVIKQKKSPLSAKNPTFIPLLDESKTSNNLYDVGPYERKLEKELGSWAKVQNDWDIEGLSGEIPTLNQLNEVFSEVKGDKSIPWEYLVDGCYSRAHVTAEKFMKKGYNCAKMYVMIGEPDMSEPTYPFPPWRLKMKNKFTEGEWWYHVAPVVFAKDEKTGEIDGYVIDLAGNSEKPVKTTEWIKNFWTGDFPIRFDITHADIYDPPMEMDGMWPIAHEFSQEKFDKHLVEAKKTNEEYNSVLKTIKDNYYGTHPEEIPSV